MFTTIAIDGGAASGKSSTARGVAARLGLMLVETGSHYRAVTWLLLRAGIDPADEDAVSAFLAGRKTATTLEGRTARLTLDGEVPPAEALRGAGVNANVSQVSALPAVRDFLFGYQRGQVAVARERGFNGLVMEGRDIGSVILPDADHRFFLEADPETRQQRRAAEGEDDTVSARDRLDTARAHAPLVCPGGATRIDTSRLSLDEVIARIAAQVQGGATAS